MPPESEYGRVRRVAHDDYGHGDRDGSESPWPGKRTLTQRLVRRRADGDAVAADAPDRLAAAGAGTGAPLPGELRSRFEASTGADLSAVRVHTGAESQRAASAVSARAYAVGQDIHFGAGHFDPSSADGQRLIAHEVAHTVQQQAGAPVQQHKLEVSAPGDAAEVEADRAAEAMVMGTPAVISSASAVIAREPDKKAAEGPGDPPPQYATLDPRVRDLMWRSKDTFEPFQKVAGKPFWERLDALGVADLQTTVQVLKGAEKQGLLASIVTLKSIYTYGSSWGIEFKGSPPPVGYPDWGYDLQWFVRREHGNTAHNWYRHNSGAGNPGMHCGVDAGAGYHNLHWDPTNPMESVGHGIGVTIVIIGGLPVPVPSGAPRGQAVYSPSALIDHAQDIGVLPGGDGHHAPRANQPFLDISILSNDFADKAKLYADMEAGASADHIDKERATAAIAALRAASADAKQLSQDARPIAMQDNSSNQAGIDELTAKTSKSKLRMFEALAGFFKHLHYELCNIPPGLAGHDSVTDWSLDINVLHPTYDVVDGLQKERRRHLKAKKEAPPSGGDSGDAGVEPLPGGLVCE